MNKSDRKTVFKKRKEDMPEEVALQKEQMLSTEVIQVEVKRTLSEREILEAVKKGDKDAYGLIVKRYMHSAYYIALGFVHNQQDALDVSQEAFIKAFRKIKMFDTSLSFFPWFYRLMRNLCIDHLKRKRWMSEIPLEDTQVLDDERDDREMKEALWKGIEELPFDQREIIILRYFRQMSYEEIAELTARPIGTVMSSLHYAKKKLKGILGKYLGFE
ncbi:MAG: sigma-70 family RNA polymerase sigma factor [Candidatus Aminicenantes bacterium]|nr:sigma-70 family RNA polymerase sigma factor [Candidatus Aminicenantes bacterium]MDH5383631.1 sigma-70 family RNA polymerase sigma factor [Candidatus Aminicenantes bacterium]MDH5742723.1 sigma-70 family RNA polymerase sigma factor [Candidatus Aminicenantes bacterium]